MIVEQYVKYYKNYIMRQMDRLLKPQGLFTYMESYGHIVCPKVHYIDMDTIL